MNKVTEATKAKKIFMATVDRLLANAPSCLTDVVLDAANECPPVGWVSVF